MDKIYSRKRFLIPKFKLNRGRIGIKNATKPRKIENGNINGVNSMRNTNNFNRINKAKNTNNVNRENLTASNFELKKNLQEKIFNRKLIKTAVIVIIAVYIANRIIATIEPTIDILCVDMAKSIATKISNEQATVVMRKLHLCCSFPSSSRCPWKALPACAA